MMTRVRLFCAALALTLAGCGVLRSIEPGESPAVVEEAGPDDLDRLLSYFARARKLPAAEQGKERNDAHQAYLRSQSEYNRVRLAMLLSLPDTAFNDEARALELIDPLTKNQRASLHTLAVLLGAYIQEQKRLSGNVQGLQQNVQGLQQNVQGLQQNVQGLQQNLQGLQHKLDALKSLDRNLIERDQGGAKKR